MTIALDLDGTLISCEPRQSAVLQVALNRFGLKADLKKVWQMKREGMATEESLLKCGVQLATARAVSEHWRCLVEDPAFLALDTVLPGVEQAIESMSASGIQLWLLTARSRPEWVWHQLERLGIGSPMYRITVVSPASVTSDKAQILRTGDVSAYIGDSESDWRAAAEANVKFFAVSSGQRSPNYLSNLGVNPIYQDLVAAWKGFNDSLLL